jgi:2-polyprenyl-3-methyl-5-hydroxy-6-metoxy-1,4-benzoquinol methylase
MAGGVLSPRNTGSATEYVEFNERPLSGHRLLLAMVPPGGRVLDVGCSGGYLAERLVARGSTVTGIELPFEPASFETIICGDLIEHLRWPDRFLTRVRPLLRPGGRLVLTTPNIANWTIRLQLLFGRFRYTDRGILDRTHAHLFTRATLLECLEGSGYEVEETEFTTPLPLIGAPLLERIAHLIGSLRPQLFAFQFVVAARPAPGR